MSTDQNDILPLQVAKMTSINFDGNITPHTWYQQLKYDNGKVNLPAIVVLGEICYWYRPTIIRDELNGTILGYRKKFKADKLQKNYSSFASLGLTKQQARDAITFLEAKNLITKETRTVILPGGQKLPNQLFIEVVADNIAKLNDGAFIQFSGSDKVCSTEQTVCSTEHEASSTDDDVCSAQQTTSSTEQTNTKITTETSSKITPKPLTPKNGNGSGSGLSKFTYEEWYEYITYCKEVLGEPIVSIPAVAKTNYLDGIQDSRLEAWLNDKMKADEKPLLDDEEMKLVLRFCPGCLGSKMESVPGKGARKCSHAGLLEKLAEAVNENDIDAALVEKYKAHLKAQNAEV